MDKEREEVRALVDSAKAVLEKTKELDTQVQKAVGDVEELKAVAKTVKEVQDLVKEQDTALKTQSDLIKGLKVVQETEDPVTEVIMKHVSSEDFKTAISNKKTFEFPVKFVTGNFASRQFTEALMPQIGASWVPEYSLTNLLSKGTTSAKTIYLIDEAAYDAFDPASAVVAEQGIKPKVSTSFTEKSVTLIKHANAARVSYEALTDAAYVTSVINNTLMRDLQRKIEMSFIYGLTPTNPNFKGLLEVKTAYTGTELDGTITNATDIEAILAAALQLELQGFNPDTLILSNEQYTKFLLLKDVNGNFIGQQSMAMLSRFNIVVTPRVSETLMPSKIAAPQFILMDSSRFYAYNDGSTVIRAGYNEDDFITNQQTFVAEQRWLNFMYTRDAGSVLSDTFANVKTALEA